MARIAQNRIAVPGPPGTSNLTDASINAAATTINAKIARTYPATVGTDGQVLGNAGGVPAWVAAATGSTGPWLYVDDYASIQAALDAAGAAVAGGYVNGNHIGGVVYIPKGLRTITAQLVIPEGVVLCGAGARATTIKAGTGFPASTALVRLGKELGQYEHNMWLHDIALDCNSITGSIGVETRTANEPSGLRSVLIMNYRQHGVYVHSATGFTASHFAVDDCELFAPTLGITGNSIFFDNVGNTSYVRRTTVSNMGTTAGSPCAIRVNDASVLAEAVHIEQHTDGLRCTAGTNNKGTLIVVGVDGHPSVAKLVHITDGSPVTVLNAVSAGSVDTIVDDVRPYSSIAANRYNEVLYTTQEIMPPMMRQPTMRTLVGSDLLYDSDRLMLVDSTASYRSVALPTAVGRKGKEYIIKNTGTTPSQVTVNANGTEKIDGAASKTITSANGVITVISDGTTWRVIGQVGTIT